MDSITIKLDSSSYPLTSKWQQLIRRKSIETNLPLRQCLQEGLILEWELKDKEFESAIHHERYFVKSLVRRIVSMKKPPHMFRKNPWRQTERCITDLEQDMLNETPVGGGISNIFVSMRSFDALQYDALVAHIASILHDIDTCAAMMFVLRVDFLYSWKEIKEQYCQQLGHNNFYNSVSLIKNIVRKEVCYA